MAKKKQIEFVGLLRSGKAVRIKKLTTQLMMKIAERTGAALKLTATPGEDLKSALQQINTAKMGNQSRIDNVALRLTGITLSPVEIKKKQRKPTAEEVKAGKATSDVIEEPDLDATLAPLRDNPSDARWTPLTEEDLMNAESDRSMFELFSEPTDWGDLLRLLDVADENGMGSNPFDGRLLATSVG